MLLHDDGFELTGGILMIEGTLLTLGLDDALGEVLRLGFDEKSNVGYRFHLELISFTIITHLHNDLQSQPTPTEFQSNTEKRRSLI
jgi:hypothetical protein